jgi:hypothetical protein
MWNITHHLKTRDMIWELKNLDSTSGYLKMRKQKKLIDISS